MVCATQDDWKPTNNSNIFTNSPNYFKFHHLKNHYQKPTIYPYNSDKGLIRLEVPVSEVESSILEDLQRQTKNFSQEFDLKPVDEMDSIEWEAKFNNRKPIMQEEVKGKTKFSEKATFEQTPNKKSRPITTTAFTLFPTLKPLNALKPLKSLNAPKKPRKDISVSNFRTTTPSYDDFLNFDAYLKHKPRVYTHPVHQSESRANQQFYPGKPIVRETFAERQQRLDPFLAIFGKNLVPPNRHQTSQDEHSFEWEEVEKEPKMAETAPNHRNRFEVSSAPYMKNLYQ